MTGVVDWSALVLLGGVGVFCASLAWWLSDQFAKNRHAMNNTLMKHLSPLRDEVDDLKERLIRLETLMNRKK